MKTVWKRLGLFVASAVSATLLLGAGACNRREGIEGGCEYATGMWATELTGVVQNGGNADAGGGRGRLEVPSKLGGKRVRSVAAGAFRNADAVSVKIPWRVSEIGAEAFAGCKNLVWVELPSRLERVEDGLFRGCRRMEVSEIPDRVEAIGAYAYAGCVRLERVVLPAKLRSVGEHAFSGCSMLESVELPAGIANVPEGAFKGCRRLKSIRIPSGVTNIGARAFAGCAALERIELPEGLREIGDGAFAGCSGLKSVEVAEGNPVFSVRDGVLFRAGGTELVLCPRTRSGAFAVPEGVERIAPGAFRDCRNLRRVTLGGGVRELGEGAFMGCSALWEFTMPDGVERTGADLFAGCDGLLLLVVPDHLKGERESWQVPDNCTIRTRSAWEEERKGKRPGSGIAPFFGLYTGEDLDTVSFEGTVLVASAMPDPGRNDYDDCLYALLVELDSVSSTTPPSADVEQVVLVNVPIMEDRTIVQENRFAPGDKISCTCALYDAMPQGIQEIQLSDDIQSFEHQQYYPLKIEPVQEFRETGSRDFAKREISIRPVRSLPRDEAAAAARRERIRNEIARIEAELARHGGSFEAWKEEYKPVAEKYARLCKEKFASWIGDSYFAAGGEETTYRTKEYIEGLLPYKKHLEENNIDLIVARVPSRWDFAARVLAADDFQENPAWVEHYLECMKNDIEIIDAMPEMWKRRFDFPLFYFYHRPKEYHPCEGTALVVAEEIAKVLERYPYQKAEPEIVLVDFACEIDKPEYFWPVGNEKFDPSQNLVIKQATQDGEPLGVVLGSGAPFLFFSSSAFWFPQGALGASIPGYAAYFLQTRTDWFYQRGDFNPLIKHLADPEILHSRRAVVMVGGAETWQGFPPMPRYVLDGARRITLEKTIPAASETITIDGKGAFSHTVSEDGELQIEHFVTNRTERADCFDLEFKVPYMDGKLTCMVRVNMGRTSHLFVHLVDEATDAVLDTSTFLPGERNVADFFVPLSKPETGVKIRFQPKNSYGLFIKDIELWYY